MACYLRPSILHYYTLTTGPHMASGRKRRLCMILHKFHESEHLAPGRRKGCRDLALAPAMRYGRLKCRGNNVTVEQFAKNADKAVTHRPGAKETRPTLADERNLCRWCCVQFPRVF